MFNFIPYSNEQSKQYINSEHLYSIYLEKLKLYHKEYKYSMFWQKNRLVKKHSRTNKKEYIGLKDENTIKIYDNFIKNKQFVKDELSTLREKIKIQAKFNKFYKINRTPIALVKILKKINELELSDKIIVIGTNSLYAYETACGVFVEQEHLATLDIDLLSKKNKKLSLVVKELLPDIKLDNFLQTIDKSFQKSPTVPYRFINKDGVMIDLINPISSISSKQYYKSNEFNNIISLEMQGMQWLENSSLFQSLIIADDGTFTYLKTISPLNFAIYKYWLSNKNDREVIKKNKDLSQSKLVTKLIQEYMPMIDIRNDALKLKHFKKEIIDDYLQFIKGKIK